MNASKTCPVSCPEDIEGMRSWALGRIAAMSADEAKGLIRLLVQREIFPANAFSAVNYGGNSRAPIVSKLDA